MYPDRLNDSLYVQSVRSHPENSNEATVLVNYRDGRNRELVRVQFNESGLSERVFSTMKMGNELNNSHNSDNNSGNSGNSGIATSAGVMDGCVDMESSYVDSVCDVGGTSIVDIGRGMDIDTNTGMNTQNNTDADSELELFEFDKPLATYPSSSIYTDMALLAGVAVGLSSIGTSNGSSNGSNGNTIISSSIMGSSNGMGSSDDDDDCADMITLYYTESNTNTNSNTNSNNTSNSNSGDNNDSVYYHDVEVDVSGSGVVHTYPVYMFILQYRCSTLWNKWQQTQNKKKNTGSKGSNGGGGGVLCLDKWSILAELGIGDNTNGNTNTNTTSTNINTNADTWGVAMGLLIQYLYTGILAPIPPSHTHNHNHNSYSYIVHCLRVLCEVLFLGLYCDLPGLCTLVDAALSRYVCMGIYMWGICVLCVCWNMRILYIIYTLITQYTHHTLHTIEWWIYLPALS